MIQSEQIKVTTTGSDGSATGAANSNTAILGRILAIRLNYHASAPATTDVTITEADQTTTLQTIWTETDSATDIVRYPRMPVQDNAENTVTYDGTNEIYEPFVTSQQIRVSVAGSNALTNCVIVDVIYEQ